MTRVTVTSATIKTSRSGCGDSRRTCRPAGPSTLPSVCADGRAGQLGWEHPSHQLSCWGTNQDLPREGLATKQAGRAAGIAGGHAGRPDPAASHRSVPTAGPGSWAGSTRAPTAATCAPHQQLPREGPATHQAGRAAGIAGGHADGFGTRPMAAAPAPSSRASDAATRSATCLPTVCRSAALGGPHAASAAPTLVRSSPPDRGRWACHANHGP